MKRNLAFAGLLLVQQAILVQSARADDAPNLGSIMWSAFSCAVYAEITSNADEQKRLFEIGYATGQKFINGIKDKSIPDSEAKNTPIGVLMRMGGPTTDFVIGRVFEGVSEDVYDKLVREDNSGMPILDPSKWADDELKTIRAENKYRESNCALIR